jgi:hypothetical protein
MTLGALIAPPVALAAPPPDKGKPTSTSTATTTSTPSEQTAAKAAAPPQPRPTRTTGVDRTKPVVLALRSSGRPGHAVRLRFVAVGDTRGSNYAARVVDRGAVVATVAGAAGSVKHRYSFLTWSAPSRLRGTFRFCVTVRDRAGNRAEGCSVLVLRG